MANETPRHKYRAISDSPKEGDEYAARWLMSGCMMIVIPSFCLIISVIFSWAILSWISTILCDILIVHLLVIMANQRLRKTRHKKQCLAFDFVDKAKGYIFLGLYAAFYILWGWLILLLVRESLYMFTVSFIKFMAILILLFMALSMLLYIYASSLYLGVARLYTETLEKSERYQRILPKVMEEVYTQYIKDELKDLEENLKKDEDSYYTKKIIRVKQLMADNKIEEAFDMFDGCGYCHTIWRLQKRILLKKYGIIWFTPSECHPWAIYD